MKRINIVLYSPEIPQNTGNIMRSCVGFDAKLHLIKPLGFSLDEKHLRRSALDYFEYLDYEVYEDYADFLKKNPDGAVFYLTRYGHKSPKEIDFKEVDSTKPIYIMFGRESSGVPEEVHNAHKGLRIPMIKTSTRSLNLSNTVCAIAYEALRQMDFPNMK